MVVFKRFLQKPEKPPQIAIQNRQNGRNRPIRRFLVINLNLEFEIGHFEAFLPNPEKPPQIAIRNRQKVENKQKLPK